MSIYWVSASICTLSLCKSLVFWRICPLNVWLNAPLLSQLIGTSQNCDYNWIDVDLNTSYGKILRYSDSNITGCQQRVSDSCSQSSCVVSESDMKSKCHQYRSDCHSCILTDGCYWRSHENPDRSQMCDIIPPAANVVCINLHVFSKYFSIGCFIWHQD